MQLTVYRRDNRKRNATQMASVDYGGQYCCDSHRSERRTLRVAQAVDGRRRLRRVSLSWRAPISLSGKFKCVGEKNSAVMRSLPWRG